MEDGIPKLSDLCLFRINQLEKKGICSAGTLESLPQHFQDRLFCLKLHHGLLIKFGLWPSVKNERDWKLSKYELLGLTLKMAAKENAQSLIDAYSTNRPEPRLDALLLAFIASTKVPLHACGGSEEDPYGFIYHGQGKFIKPDRDNVDRWPLFQSNNYLNNIRFLRLLMKKRFENEDKRKHCIEMIRSNSLALRALYLWGYHYCAIQMKLERAGLDLYIPQDVNEPWDPLDDVFDDLLLWEINDTTQCLQAMPHFVPKFLTNIIRAEKLNEKNIQFIEQSFKDASLISSQYLKQCVEFINAKITDIENAMQDEDNQDPQCISSLQETIKNMNQVKHLALIEFETRARFTTETDVHATEPTTKRQKLDDQNNNNQ